MKEIFKYKLAKRTWYWILFHIILFTGAGILTFIYSSGGYILAWVISFEIAVLALMILSIPRRIEITDEGIDIFCVSDHTFLAWNQIIDVRNVDDKELKRFTPLFASYGFFGFYGYYFDIKNLEKVILYASRWKDFIEITNIYEERIYISSNQKKKLLEILKRKVTETQAEGEYV